MMDRQQMLQILAVMDEGKLKSALQAAGINCGPGGGSYRPDMDSPATDDEEIVPWNAVKVSMPRSSRPSLFDHTSYLEDASQAAAQPAPPRGGGLQLPPQHTGMEAYAALPELQGMT